VVSRIICLFSLVAVAAFPQASGSVQGAVQQRISEIKNSIARNQAQLKQYSWIETIEISLKGDVRKREQNACRYGPDGKVQKMPIGEPAPPPTGGRLKRRIVANKTEELKDYMGRVSGLLRRYIPPDPQSMQASFKAGKVTLEPGPGAVLFSDYVKTGDKVTLTFDVPMKRLLEFSVTTYLDEPKEAVTINARFSTLPDGTNFMEESVLNASAKQIRIDTSNFQYQRVAQ
jgi:hypothetical protein